MPPAASYSAVTQLLKNPDGMEHRGPYLHLDLGPELGVEGERGDFSPRFLRGLSKALGGSFPLPSFHSAVSEKSRPFPIIERKGE